MVAFLKKYLLSIIIIIGLAYYYYNYKIAPKIKLDEISFKTLEGTDFPKGIIDGKYLFINVIATWCGPCRAELPTIENARLSLINENIEFLVVSDEPLSLLNKFRSTYPFSYTYLQMQESRASLGINTIPTTYILSPTGEILFKEVGSKDWSSPENIEMIRDLIVD